MTKPGSIPDQATTQPGYAAGLARQVGFSSASRQLSAPTTLPVISRPLLRLFSWYSQRYVRRHFHSLRVSLLGLPPARLHLPAVIYSNHASWWDPLVGLALMREFLPDRSVFTPMEETALERYGFFKRLGAFGVEQETRRGAMEFLRKSEAILQDQDHVLWLTPQARFADARERPVQIKAGLAHLPRLAERICFVPVAIEYVFWEERLPEILVRFGQPYESSSADVGVTPKAWTKFFSGQLALTQDSLAAEALQRDSTKFRCLLDGRTGVGGIYDRWRAFKAGLRGERFRPEHGKL